MKKARFYRIRSFTDPERFYTVRCMPNGAWLCSCPHFLMRQRQIGECKHIRRVRKRVAHAKKYRTSAKGRAAKQAWYDRNQERIIEYNRIYYLENKEAIKAQRRERIEALSRR